MATLIGYKFEIVYDNGDSNEWFRETHLTSPIYTTREAAEAAIKLVKNKMLQDAKMQHLKYVSFQLKYEYKHNRNVNEFLSSQCRNLYTKQKNIIQMMKTAEIITIFAEETPTDVYNVCDLAH